MEEADLLRERLQAITEKRRIQEGIAKKRREIEEIKLKLQYLKKKALREQWLMDGLSGQNDENEEAMRAQAQEEQQQAELLQNDIDRMESEICALETREMNISKNEELILKRLKEVEKTAEDIIKEVNGEFQAESIRRIYSAIPDIPTSYTPTFLRRIKTVEKPEVEPEKKAMYALEISVEKDLHTGRSQVLSSAAVSPQEFQQKGVKVFDDGRKSVYALQPAGTLTDDGLDELSPLEVEELLRKATEKKAPSDVEYHEPVFSSSYSRSCTPRKGERGVVSPAPNGFHMASKTPSPLQPDCFQKQEAQHQAEACQVSDSASKQCFPPDQPANQRSTMEVKGYGEELANEEELIQEPEEQQWLTPESDSELEFERISPLHLREDLPFKIVNAIPSELDCKPITMIFMGYQNAPSDEEEEEMQAELVVIASDEDETDQEPPLSYHPRGYHSKIFQPRSNNVHRSEVRPGFFRNQGKQGKTEDPNASGSGRKTSLENESPSARKNPLGLPAARPRAHISDEDEMRRTDLGSLSPRRSDINEKECVHGNMMGL